MPVKEDDSLADRQTHLGAAETQHIDAGAPGEVGRCQVQRRHGVGEARAIHMHPQAVLLGDAGDSADLALLVQRAHFGGLGQRHHLGPGVMHIGAARNHFQHTGRGQLAVAMRCQQQLGAIGEELRRAAFVGFHVRRVGADHGLVGLAQCGQRNRVGGRAVEDKKDFGISLEQLAQAITDEVGGVVVAVGRGKSVVGQIEGAERLRADAGAVVAGELQEVARAVDFS